eukprot:Em0002g1750a
MESCRQSVCDETLSQVKVYLAEGSYPLGATDDVRRIIRKRSKDFQVDGDTSTMYYIKQESKRIVLFGDIDRRRAFTECHASSSGGHQGSDRTEGRMKQYYWPSMHLDIRKWISECESCQRMNPSVKCPTLDLQPVPVTGLWEMFGAGDIVTDQGREFVNKVSLVNMKGVELKVKHSVRNVKKFIPPSELKLMDIEDCGADEAMQCIESESNRKDNKYQPNSNLKEQDTDVVSKFSSAECEDDVPDETDGGTRTLVTEETDSVLSSNSAGCSQSTVKQQETPKFYQLMKEHDADVNTDRHSIFIHDISHFSLKVRRNVPGDGNCLFTAICDQLLKEKVMRKRHHILRQDVVNFMRDNPYSACTIRQTNAIDCGVLVCKFADCIVKKLPLTFSTSSIWLRSWLAMRLIHPSSKINYEEMRIFLSLCKDFVPQDVQDALQRIMSAQHNDSSDLQTAETKCFYERDAMNLRLWKKPLPFFVDIDKKLSLKQLVNLCHNSEVEAVKHFLYGIAIDEGADGLRAISLAWDVLYPELIILLVRKDNTAMNYEEAAVHYLEHITAHFK